MNRPSIYRRPDKPLFLNVTRRRDPAPLATLDLAAPVMVDKTTECHVTPADVAGRMVEYLGPMFCDCMTLEPSAGTGQLTRALLAAGQSKFEICQIERHNTLAAQLHKLAPTINRCFLEYAEEARGKVEFPRVIMNPPFSQVRQHVAAALSLMGNNGHNVAPVLVALVPVTFHHPDAETLETLPPDTFETAKVNTKIIRIYTECQNSYHTELTQTGEQLVIPGCERNLAPAKKQLDLFG